MKISNYESITEISIRFVSEFTATAMLVCFTCMSCIDTPTFPSSLLQTALHGGFVVGVCIQCFGCISGAHINPVVSVSSFILGNISLTILGVYVAAQFWGAILGFALFWSVIPMDAFSSNVCLTLIHPSVNTGQALLIEFLLTGTLIFFCCGVWHEKNAKYMDSVALKFAMIVTCMILAGGHYTGASINPARSLAPALFQRNFNRLWVYFLSQFSAGVIVPLTWMYFYSPKEKKSNAKIENIVAA